MSEPESNQQPGQTSGWGDVESLEIRPRADRGPVKFSFGLLVSIWVFLCASVSSFLAPPVGGTRVAAELFGYVLGTFLGMWLMTYALGWVVYRIGGRSLAAGRIAVCLLAALAVAGNLGRSLDHSKQTRQDQAALTKELRGAYAAMSQSAEGSEPLPALESSAPVGRESAEIQAFMNSYFNKAIAQHNDYMAELEAIGWNRVLDPDRIQQDAGLVESRAIVSRAKVTVAKFRQRSHALFEEAAVLVNAMDTNSGMKRGFVTGFRKSSSKGNDDAMRVWAMEAEIVATTEQIIQLLSDPRVSWAFESEQFVFADDQSLALFNGYVDRINELVRLEQEIQSANRARVKQNLEQLEAN